MSLEVKADAHTDWMNECVPSLMSMGKDQIVAVAACLNMWRDAWEESHPDGADDPGPSPKEASEDSPLQDARRLQMAVIDGRLASMANIEVDGVPMVKIGFDDGEIRLAIWERKDALRTFSRERDAELLHKYREQQRLKGQWAASKQRSRALLEKGQFIRDPETGEFMGSLPGPGHGEGEGSSGDGGDKKPAAVRDYKAGIKARADAFKKVREKWVDESPVKTIEDVIRDAPKAQAALADAGNKIAAKLGIKFKNPTAKTQTRDKETGKVVENPKGVARILEKLAERGPGTPIARITDTARGTFIVNAYHEAEKALEALGETHEVIDEGWRTIPDSHYTDRPLLFRDRSTGIIGEVQITHPGLLDAKDNRGGHKVYDEARSLKPGDPKIAVLNAKMQALYGAVLDKLEGDWKKIDRRRDRR
jgi:hypothetical protein